MSVLAASRELGQLGRDIVIPDLSDEDLTFVGGRLFFVNGQPVGQIAYHDAEGRLTGFCIRRAPDEDNKPLSVDERDQLKMINWQDEGYQYVLVGFAEEDKLRPIAEILADNAISDI